MRAMTIADTPPRMHLRAKVAATATSDYPQLPNTFCLRLWIGSAAMQVRHSFRLRYWPGTTAAKSLRTGLPLKVGVCETGSLQHLQHEYIRQHIYSKFFQLFTVAYSDFNILSATQTLITR
jgi:hypothetical protein